MLRPSCMVVHTAMCHQGLDVDRSQILNQLLLLSANIQLRQISMLTAIDAAPGTSTGTGNEHDAYQAGSNHASSPIKRRDKTPTAHAKQL